MTRLEPLSAAWARLTHLVDAPARHAFLLAERSPLVSLGLIGAGLTGVGGLAVLSSALSPDAVGHTGYTGTSLWIDPAGPEPAIYVLLSNRVHPTRDNPRIKPLRRRFHELAAQL